MTLEYLTRREETPSDALRRYIGKRGEPYAGLRREAAEDAATVAKAADSRDLLAIQHALIVSLHGSARAGATKQLLTSAEQNVTAVTDTVRAKSSDPVSGHYYVNAIDKFQSVMKIYVDAARQANRDLTISGIQNARITAADRVLSDLKHLRPQPPRVRHANSLLPGRPARRTFRGR